MFDLGEDKGTRYITMECVHGAGPPLALRRPGQLPRFAAALRLRAYFLMTARMFLTRAARSPSGSSVRNFSKAAMAAGLSALLRKT